MKVMVRRFIMWMTALIISYGSGLYIDYIVLRFRFPIYISIVGILGIIIAFRLLQVSGRMLRKFGDAREWGVTQKLVTTGIYSCLRHPHHLGIGLFASSITLVIGGVSTFLISSTVIWLLIIWFLKNVEEPELIEKFGEDYIKYRDRVPMIIPNIGCLLRELYKGV